MRSTWPVGPWMLGSDEAVVDAGAGAGALEGMSTERFFARDLLSDLGRAPGVAAGVGEEGTVVGQHGVELVGHGPTGTCRKSAAVRVGALACGSVRANFEVRSIATNR
jgi:hypothetical protein